MAFCRVCHRWAGLFVPIHDKCLDQLSETASPPPTPSTSEQPPKPHTETASVGFSFNLPHEVLSVSVRAERTGPHAQRIIASVPDIEAVVGRELRRGHVKDQWVIAKITARLLSSDVLDAGERPFIKWCQSEDAPFEVRSFDKDRLSALYWAGFSLDASARNLENRLSQGVALALPFMRIDGYACWMHSGGVLDLFTAHADDPIWTAIWPPNGWFCSCVTVSLLASEADESASVSGIKRIPPNVWSRCADWYVRSPREGLKKRVR